MARQHGQVVDTESAREFLKEALARVSDAELGAIADEVEVKSRRFRQLLGRDGLAALGEDRLRAILRSVFSTRRRADELLQTVGSDALRDRILQLLYGDGPLPARFQAFHDGLDTPHEHIRFDLPAELLHYSAPDDYWLWTRWMWDPKTGTGALPLVVMDGHDLRGATAGETYVRIGEAVSFVKATGEAAGFTRFGDGPFGIDLYLACVYGVYVFTTLRLRMTQEFGKVLPPLPELCRRLLGVHRMEV